MLYFNDVVRIDVPEVALHVGVAHAVCERYVAMHLVGVLGLRLAELEVDDLHFVAAFHHAVGAVLRELVGVWVVAEDGTLVEECPAAPEPLLHLRVREALVEHVLQFVRRDDALVEQTFHLHVVQTAVYVVGGLDVREQIVEQQTRLDVRLLLCLLVVSLVADEVATLVALLELYGRGVGFHRQQEVLYVRREDVRFLSLFLLLGGVYLAVGQGEVVRW